MRTMKILKPFYLLLLITSIISCDKDDSGTNGEEPQTTTQATIDSFSKNFGYSGESITINGTNFTTDITKVKVYFDDVVAVVNSVNSQEINVKLPSIEKSVPILKVEIENTNFTNNVENDYNGNIGILINSPNLWHSLDFNTGDHKVWKMQVIGKEKAYFSLNNNGGGGSVYRTIDGGITWGSWCPVGFDGAFYATSNDEGWSQTTFGVNKVPVGGSNSFNSDVHPSSSTIGLYVSDDLSKGFLISYQKKVYKTTDGVTFEEVYNNDPTSNEDPHGNSSNVRVFSEFDENNIWAGGFIEVDQNLGYTPINKFYAPLILFLDNGTWTERSIPGLDYSARVMQIQFIDENKGYFYVKNFRNDTPALNYIYKSIDGGNSWDIIYDSNDLRITSFSFKNETLGWFCSENKIYKTTDGGINWTIDYTHSSDIKNISYNDGIVWAVTEDKILKYFTE